MARVLQVIDVDNTGHKVRLSDGRYVHYPLGGAAPRIGEEYVEEKKPDPPEPKEATFVQAADPPKPKRKKAKG